MSHVRCGLCFSGNGIKILTSWLQGISIAIHTLQVEQQVGSTDRDLTAHLKKQLICHYVSIL